MLRDRSLIPLSHQHQHALALCVRIERALEAGPTDLSAWQFEVDRHYEQEIKFHFAAEEEVLFPTAHRFAELAALVDELLREHEQLRTHFTHAKKRTMDATQLGRFAQLLSGHIRKEERRLFEGMQKLLSSEELTSMGKELERTLEAASRACSLHRHDPRE